MNVKPVSINTINRKFESFAKQSLQNPQNVDPHYFNAQFGSFKNQYTKFRKLDLFADKMMDFAAVLQAKGLRDMAGIVYSGLAKLPFPPKKRIAMLERAIENAEAQGDKFHVLGRIVDLKALYKSEGMPKEYLKNLLREEKCLKGIVTDFEESKSGFKSIERAPMEEHVYRFHLAQVRIDIAKACMRQNPKQALTKIKAAKKFFEANGYPDDDRFAQILIDKISSRKGRHTKRLY